MTVEKQQQQPFKLHKKSIYVGSNTKKRNSLVDQKLDKTHICAVYKAALQSKSIYNLLDLVPKVIYILRAADGTSINDGGEGVNNWRLNYLT